MDKESQILGMIQRNPFISQREIADELDLARPAVSGYIASLIKSGKIKGRAYILPEPKGVTCIGGAHMDRKATCRETIQYETSNPVTMTETCGGVVRNISENLGRLGAIVSLISMVGNDKEGEWVIKNTGKYGVDTSQIHKDKKQTTGTYTAILDKNGNMAVAVADMNIYEQMTVPFIMQKWPHIAQSSLVVLDTNLPEQTLFYLTERCKLENIPVIVDPVSTIKSKKLMKSLSGIHSILPNKEEAEVIAGMEIHGLDHCKEAARKIHGLGVKNVIITLGSQGVFASSGQEAVHLAAFPVRTVDVTGAGDAFAAGYLFGLSKKKEFVQSCQYGLALASLTLQTGLSVYPHLTAERMTKLVEENECISI
ncbi:winged helix-turn-helix transcriptional regulator [Fictibacillus enclensis]|uniref:carbohydrate kinase n=1 Tax=Fictibacillus enclensis TaxID=1017270 RepID=UPI0025A049E0|nr:carbohydrate kinase [Fictibacillus enclensis]MDM5340721.1 winged helix-turn-helix transcriptional regulator [Fictibacillus enclensis]